VVYPSYLAVFTHRHHHELNTKLAAINVVTNICSQYISQLNFSNGDTWVL